MVISVLDDLGVVGKPRVSAFQRRKDRSKRSSPLAEIGMRFGKANFSAKDQKSRLMSYCFFGILFRYSGTRGTHFGWVCFPIGGQKSRLLWGVYYTYGRGSEI